MSRLIVMLLSLYLLSCGDSDPIGRNSGMGGRIGSGVKFSLMGAGGKTLHSFSIELKKYVLDLRDSIPNLKYVLYDDLNKYIFEYIGDAELFQNPGTDDLEGDPGSLIDSEIKENLQFMKNEIYNKFLMKNEIVEEVILEMEKLLNTDDYFIFKADNAGINSLCLGLIINSELLTIEIIDANLAENGTNQDLLNHFSPFLEGYSNTLVPGGTDSQGTTTEQLENGSKLPDPLNENPGDSSGQAGK